MCGIQPGWGPFEYTPTLDRSATYPFGGDWFPALARQRLVRKIRDHMDGNIHAWTKIRVWAHGVKFLHGRGEAVDTDRLWDTVDLFLKISLFNIYF